MKIDGILAPLTTPFAADGSVAVEKLRDNVARYNRTPLSGYVATGSTGEAVLLTSAEAEQIWTGIAKTASSGKTLIAGTGAESTAETIARCRRAASIGYHAVLVKTPHYFKSGMTPTALETHYRSVADASPVPVFLYNIPQNTGIAMTADLVARLAMHPNIVGIKESSGNVPLLAEIIQSAGRDFQAIAGSASAILGGLAVGAAGGILGLACFLPDLCTDLYAAWRAGNATGAREIQLSVLPASRKIVAELGPAGVKYAMDRAGYYGGQPRAPLLPLAEAQKGIVDAALTSLLPAALP
jgi:4-hydroxy-2-oxoglutarate aldolase